jgi:hypothetical protein
MLATRAPLDRNIDLRLLAEESLRPHFSLPRRIGISASTTFGAPRAASIAPWVTCSRATTGARERRFTRVIARSRRGCGRSRSSDFSRSIAIRWT